jgi:uncharacterized protein (DUF305 family)
MTCNKLKLQVGSTKEQHNLKDSTDCDSFVLEQFRSSDTLNISNVKRSLARHQQLPEKMQKEQQQCKQECSLKDLAIKIAKNQNMEIEKTMAW